MPFAQSIMLTRSILLTQSVMLTQSMPLGVSRRQQRKQLGPRCARPRSASFGALVPPLRCGGVRAIYVERPAYTPFAAKRSQPSGGVAAYLP
jgi:hypothetical protein